MKKAWHVALLVVIATFVGGVGLLVPRIASAQVITNIFYFTVGKVVFAVSYICAVFSALFIAMEAWVLAIIFGINTQIASSPPVQLGFPIVLQLANLFFVLGIIVIAIATILRLESYGIKKILWKLLVMAILVNFGLVICAPILAFSDSISIFFLNSIDPGGGGFGGATSMGSKFSNFGITIAGAFNPQSYFVLCAITDATQNDANDLTTALAGLVVPITSLFFVIVALVAIMVIMGVLIITLLHRYVEMGVLLVLLPLAWASWAFPAFSSNHHKWWERFTKQLFYPPLVIFFLWLALQTSYSLKEAFGKDNGCNSPGAAGLYLEHRSLAATSPTNIIADTMSIKTAFAADASVPLGGAYQFTEYVAPSNSAYAGLSGFIGDLLSPILQNFLRMIIILGVMTGGIAAAKQLGIKGFEVAEKAVDATTGTIKNWAGGKARRLSTAPLRSKFGEKARTALQSDVNFKSLPGWLNKTLSVAKQPIRYAGQGLDALSAQGGSKEVARAKKALAPMSLDDIARQLPGYTNEKRMAAIEMLREGGGINKIDVKAWLMDREAEFKRFGQSKTYEGAQKQIVYDDKMMAAEKKFGIGSQQFAAAVKQFVGTMTKEEAAKVEINHLLADAKYDKSGKEINKPMGFDHGTREFLRKLMFKGAAERNEQIMSVFLGKSKGDNVAKLDKEYLEALRSGNVSKADEKEKRWNDSMKHAITGGAGHDDGGGHGGGGGGAPPPPTPAPTSTPTPHTP